MIRAAADRVILADGWARAAIAVAAGALGALAMPPFGLWPVLFVSCPVAVWLIDGSDSGSRFRFWASLRRAAFAGWLWGFGYFVAGLWWLGSAFLVEPDKFALLLPFGVLGLPAFLALYHAAGFALARALWSRGPLRLFAFALGLAAAEWLRGHVVTGFPWNALGLALGQNLWLMQAGALVGMYGLTAVAALVFAAPATVATEDHGRPGRLLPTILAGLVLAGMAGWGAARIPAEEVATVAGVKLRIVQPNLPQDAKFRPSAGAQILADYLALSDRATSPETTGLVDVTHVIWPESAFPFLLHRAPEALARIAAALPPGGTLVTGAARRDDEGESGPRYFNAIQAVAKSGAITATYDKVHLVPFGEYVPAAVDGLLKRLGISQFVRIPGGFSAGERRAPLQVDGLPPAAATVCYEAIFPDEIAPDGPRAALILNVTNDGWFGDTPGPRQHFAQARLRAVEQGLPLVRAANTGISAVVDPYGRILGSLPVGRAATLDSKLPVAAEATPYAKFGNAVLIVLCTVYTCAALVGRFGN